MEGRERDQEIDDWFDEPDVVPPRRRRGRRSPGREEIEDSWVMPGAAPPPGRPARELPRTFVVGGRTLSTGQAGLLGAVAIVLFLAVLAAAGVFSGGGATPAAATTTTALTPTVPVQTTPVTPPTPPKPTLTLPSSTVKPGDSGTAVKQIQRALVRLGYLKGKVDGVYGPQTKTAVVAFQKASNLSTDGIAGPKTIATLRQALAGKTG